MELGDIGMNKTRQGFVHAVSWIILILFFILLSGKGKFTYNSFVMYGFFGLINISIFYINYLIILPEFLSRKKYFWYAVSIIILVCTSALFKYGLAKMFENIVMVRGMKKEYHLSFTEYFIGAAFIGCFFIFLSTAFKFMIDWFVNENVKTILQNEKLTAELAFLKSQVNPHFLFNTLNNIYSLAYQQSEKTPAAILKLSEIMRYMLYESNEEVVELKKEISYLENYIELQKLRFKNEPFVNLVIVGTADSQKIMPLVLISFVENAFKHGIATIAESPIEIYIHIEAGKVRFKVSNKINRLNKDEQAGIGLLNVKRRLQLFYNDHYRLEVTEIEDIYTSDLEINLN